MYFAYGWPKLLRAVDHSTHRELVVSVCTVGEYLVLVTSTVIQIWTAGQHRVKIGEVAREAESLEQDGANECASFNEAASTLAVLTGNNSLLFYDVITTDKRLPPELGADSQAVPLVSVRFRSRTAIPLQDEGAGCTALTGDDDHLLVGISNGRLQLVSWRGQLRGSSDLWAGGSDNVSGTSFIPEANAFPIAPQSPAYETPTASAGGANGHAPDIGIADLEYCRELKLLVAVLADGRVVLCSSGGRGLRPVNEIVPERWVGVADAVCAAVGPRAEVLAVGSQRATVELFDLSQNAAYLRTIALFDWGYSVEDTGPVSCIRWTPDNAAFAVGWCQRGLAVWSVSGCRLMCTIRQGSVSHALPPVSPGGFPRTPSKRSAEPMAGGVGGLAWGQYGYQLVAAEAKSASRLVQFPFARMCVTRPVVGNAQVFQLMQAEDRVLLVQSDDEEELKLQHLVVPRNYLAANWPVLHVAANEDGSYLAIAGRRGLTLYNIRAKRWRVFGDIAQEKQVACVGLLWLGRIVVACLHREATNSFELCLYPRYHLDESSLLCRLPLPDRPIAMDTWQDYILVATMPFDIRVFHIHVDGELSPLSTPPVRARTVRELSIMSARKPPIDMRFVPTSGFPELDQASSSASGGSAAPSGPAPLGGGIRDQAADAVLRQPTRCMLLRTDGELSLLDLDRGSERALVAGVEHFWLTGARAREEELLMEEVPWWAYGHRGMQVWYPSSPADTSTSSTDLDRLDPELDFDREVYPLGVSPAAGVIVGISQRLALSACSDMPCFEPIPQAQPILPCLLRHLLQRGALEEAVQLARLSASRPHFSHSLEWLLFTVFDAEMAQASARRKAALKAQQAGRPGGKTPPGKPPPPEGRPPGQSMLQRACDLIRHFPEFLDVVVSVARKTDSRHWAELFAAAGKSTELFEECLKRKQYRTATCYILVVEKLDGPTMGQRNALRLLQTCLTVSLYELAGELVRFLLRSGRDYSASGREDEKDDGILKSFFRFGFTSASPQVRADVLHATVKHILGDHAVALMQRKELAELVAFIKGTQFDFVEFLQSDRARAARAEDFPSALRSIRSKVGGDNPKLRSDAEFLLYHMRTAGSREWTLIFSTVLRRQDVLLEVFRADTKVWGAYSRTLRAQPNAHQYEDFLKELERQLGTAAPNGTTNGQPPKNVEIEPQSPKLAAGKQ